MPLNDLRCKNAKPKIKPYKLYDSEGLYLAVTSNGARLWRFKYRYLGKEKLLSLGSYPEISLQEARKLRDDAKASLRQSKDPAFIKTVNKLIARQDVIDTVEAVFREWHSQFYRDPNDQNAKRILSRLKAEIFPTLGKYPIRQVTPLILLRCLQRTAARSPDLARRLLQYCTRAFGYAGLTERIDKDPTLGVKDGLEKPVNGHFSRIELEQLGEFLDALFTPPPPGREINNFAAKLIILFGTRTKELLHAETSEFDRKGKIWTINSDRIKRPREQAKIRRDHLVPISTQAERILQELDDFYGPDRKYLLPSPRLKTEPICTHGILKELDRIGYKGVMTGHGARSLLMDVGMELLEYPYHVMDRQLGHVPKSEVMRAYNRALYLPQRKQFMQDYADKLEEILHEYQQRKTNDRNSQIYSTVTKHKGCIGYIQQY